VPDDNDREERATVKPVQRLCSEIQLFDLCDLERCSHKEGRYCTDSELLARFERIAEKDDTRPVPDSSLFDDGDDGDDEDNGIYGHGPDDDDQYDGEDE